MSAAALGASPSTAAAQATERADVVVTASRTLDPDEATGVTVIDRQTIDLLQPVSAAELLDRVAGVRAFERGGIGGPTYLSIRGGEPNFTLILLEGMRLNNPTNSRGGAFDFSQLDPAALQEVQIARGALSAVHGADALAGVVSLQLRDLGQGERLLSASGSLDTDGGRGATATAATGWGRGNILAGAGWFDSGGFDRGSEFDRRQVYARASQEAGSLLLSGLGLHSQTRRRAFPEDSGGPRLAINRELEDRHTQLTVAGATVAASNPGWWRPRLSLSWSSQRDDVDTPAIAPGPIIPGVPAIALDTRFDRLEATFENRFDLVSWARIALGANWYREEGEGEGSIDFGFPVPTDFSIDREVFGAFAEASVRPAPWLTLIGGVRVDDPSSHRSEWTARAGARIEKGGWAALASWSQGYKLPSLYALAYPIIANPDLKPERSTSLEAGVEKSWSERGRARAVYFQSRYRDLVDFDPELFKTVNRSRVTANGFEASADLPLSPAVTVVGNVTYLDLETAAGIAPLRWRPKWQGLAAVEWRASDKLTLLASGAYVGRYFDSSVPTGVVRLDDHYEVTASVRYRLTDSIAITVTAHNLLSEDFEEAIGWPAPGRTIRAALTFTPR